MGNDEQTVESLEDMLGLDKEINTNNDNSGEIKETTEQTTTPPKTTTITDEQITINQDITKLDVKIEQLEAQSVDVNTFYANLDDELSEEEQQLELDDKPAYLALVASKAKEYEKKNSNGDEIQKLKDEKEDLNKV